MFIPSIAYKFENKTGDGQEKRNVTVSLLFCANSRRTPFWIVGRKNNLFELWAGLPVSKNAKIPGSVVSWWDLIIVEILTIRIPKNPIAHYMWWNFLSSTFIRTPVRILTIPPEGDWSGGRVGRGYGE